MDPAELEEISAALEHDSVLREKLRDQSSELEKKTRMMMGILNRIHFTKQENVKALIDSVQPTLATCKEPLAAIACVVPENQYWRFVARSADYYRWKEIWARHVQNAVFVAVLCEYTRSKKLLSIKECSEMIGFQSEWKDRVYLQVEDYLHGLVSVVNELSRLAVNSVTLHNYEEPFRISDFVKDVFAGFSMLNLKNDTLRKRFDSLKYDLKKIEEVVYDVSLRQLVPPKGEVPPPKDGST